MGLDVCPTVGGGGTVSEKGRIPEGRTDPEAFRDETRKRVVDETEVPCPRGLLETQGLNDLEGDLSRGPYVPHGPWRRGPAGT